MFSHFVFGRSLKPARIGNENRMKYKTRAEGVRNFFGEISFCGDLKVIVNKENCCVKRTSQS